MNRRDLIKKTALLGAFLSLPKLAFAKVKDKLPKMSKMTIADILVVSFPSVRQVMLDGHDWVDPQLRKLAKENRLMVRTLGPCIMVPQDPPPHKHYEPSEVTVPIAWSKEDDERNDTENKKINVVHDLLKNAFECMDDVILEKIGAGRAVASREYRYELGEVMRLKDGNFMVKLYTAITFID